MNAKGKNGNRKNHHKNGSISKQKKGDTSFNRDRSTSDLDVRTHDGNDPAWYAGNPQLMKDAASLAFSNPLGNTLSTPVKATGFSSAERNAMPGIMTLSVMSTPGISEDNSSPINVAARSMYSFVRHANSGHSNYDSPDLMLYCLAVDSCYTAWAWMVRAYGALFNYSRYNRYYAKSVVEAMGFDYDDLIEHIADFRAYINSYAFKLGSICIPANMSYMNRHIWQMSRIWVDSPSNKAQTYMYVPAAFWKYDETGDSNGGRLVPIHDFDLPGVQNITFENVRDMCDEMIAAILESEDLMIMSGDILKAYGEGSIQKISTIPENVQVLPVYNEEVCSQFQNAISMDGYPTEDSFIINQNPDTGAIIFNPQWTVTEDEAVDIRYLYLNLRKDNPEPSDIMVATRCMVVPRFNGTTKYLTTCGSDIVIRTMYYAIEQTGAQVTMRNWEVPSFRKIRASGLSFANVIRTIKDLVEVEKFDWHPYTYLTVVDSAGATRYLGTSGDVDNYTQVTEYELDKMNVCALLSQFGHANMGAFVTGNGK